MNGIIKGNSPFGIYMFYI